MPFEGEFASYEPLRRLLTDERLKDIKERLAVRNNGNEDDLTKLNIVNKLDLNISDWQPNYVIGIDGSFHAVPVQNGFPGAEVGYVTVASVLLMLDRIRALEDKEFISPKEFRETEKASTFDSTFAGSNVVIDNEIDAKSSMRKLLYEQLLQRIEFSEGETLLDTYEALLKIKRKKDGDNHPPKCPCDMQCDFVYGYGEYDCSNQGCTKKLFSTDALRLHELHNDAGTCGEMYGQIMSTLERLWLVHLLRAFERKNWLPVLNQIAFMIDGPLAVFSTSSWLTKSISDELQRINELQKKINGNDLLIFGVEKTGKFVNHFDALDNWSENKTDNDDSGISLNDIKNGKKEKFPRQSALLLDDNYIKKNIIFSQSEKIYGKDTYFGRKFFYKTKTGYKVVISVATFNETQQNLVTAEVNQFPRLADTMNLLDNMTSNRYPNSVSPLIAAHSEAAIPLHLGKKLFDEIAREIRKHK